MWRNENMCMRLTEFSVLFVARSSETRMRAIFLYVYKLMDAEKRICTLGWWINSWPEAEKLPASDTVVTSSAIDFQMDNYKIDGIFEAQRKIQFQTIVERTQSKSGGISIDRTKGITFNYLSMALCVPLACAVCQKVASIRITLSARIL